MSATTVPLLSREGLEYCHVWFESLRQVLEQIRGEPFTLQSPSHDAGDPYAQLEAEGLWVRFSAEKRLRGEQALFISKPDALALAGILMWEPPDAAAELDDEHTDAVAELLRQAAGAAATALGDKLGGEVGLVFRASDRPRWAPAVHVAMSCSSAQVSSVGVHLFLSPELAAAIGPTTTAESDVAPRDQSRTTNPLPQLPRDSDNLRFLRDVELEAYLRFGERQVLLRDILDLGRGGVVELDKQLQEPVELLVGQKVVARGQPVIVDGNFGLRVTEIVAREERLDSVRR